MDGYAYFPSIVYREEHPEWVEQTLRVSQKYYATAAQNRQDPTSPVLQTGHMAQDQELAFLTEYIINSAINILQSQGYSVDKYGFYLSGLWGQDVHCAGSTNVHVHKNSQICGWFFLETPQDGAYPVYYDTRMNKQMMELDFYQGSEVSNATSAIHFKNVQPGTFLFANSWMQHQLTQNNAQTKTKAIHFIVSHTDK